MATYPKSDPIPKLIRLASTNSGKLHEFSRLLAPLKIQTLGLMDMPEGYSVDEPGPTFEANARKKALQALQEQPTPDAWVLADDSGLQVAALDNRPGIFSARYAALCTNRNAHQDIDAANRKQILTELAAIPNAPRDAQLVCTLVMAWTSHCDAGNSTVQTLTFAGACPGQIAHAPRGEHGFGYDPIFIPTGHTRTFGEFLPHEKNKMSHRAKALELLLADLYARSQAIPIETPQE